MSSQKNLKKVKPHIPDDIIINNIISRLPARDVCRYRCVHKSWNDVTTTLCFRESHLRHARPFLLVLDINNKNRMSPFLLNKWWDLDLLKPTTCELTNYPRRGMIRADDGFSLDGLIVLKESSFVGSESRAFLIFNPIYSDQEVRVRLPPKFMIHSDIYAAFFHPVSKEYCTLWRIVERPNMNSDLESMSVKYKLLNIGPEPCWREIYNPWSQNNSMVFGTQPVYANGAIYWMVKDNQVSFLKSIMVYQIITERFELISNPSELNGAIISSVHIRLLNIDGLPSLVHIIEIHGSIIHIHIWTLRNNEEPFWTFSIYYAIGNEKRLSDDFLVPIAISDGILAFHNGKRIFRCNLRRGKITMYGRGKYNKSTKFWCHIESLISLKCRPLINMEDDKQI